MGAETFVVEFDEMMDIDPEYNHMEKTQPSCQEWLRITHRAARVDGPDKLRLA